MMVGNGYKRKVRGDRHKKKKDICNFQFQYDFLDDHAARLLQVQQHWYLVRFDCSGQLRRQENVLLSGWVVQVDQDPAFGVRLVKGVVCVRAARLALFDLLGGLGADVDDWVVLGGAKIDQVCKEERGWE